MYLSKFDEISFFGSKDIVLERSYAVADADADADAGDTNIAILMFRRIRSLFILILCISKCKTTFV